MYWVLSIFPRHVYLQLEVRENSLWGRGRLIGSGMIDKFFGYGTNLYCVCKGNFSESGIWVHTLEGAGNECL